MLNNVFILIIFIIIALIIHKYAIFYLFFIVLPLFSFHRFFINNIPIYYFDIITFACFVKFILFRIDSNSVYRLNIPRFWFFFLPLGFISFLISILLLNYPVLETTYLFLRYALPLTVFLWSYLFAYIDQSIIYKFVKILIFSTTISSILSIGVFYNISPFINFAEKMSPLSPSIARLVEWKKAGYNRLFWDLQTSTATGDLLVVVIILTSLIFFYSMKSKIGLTLAFIALSANTIAISLTFSRHSWVGLFIGMFVLFLLLQKKRETKYQFLYKVAFIIIISLCLFITIQYVTQSIKKGDKFAEDFIYRFGLYGSRIEIGQESRINRLYNAFNNIIEEPFFFIFGTGPGTFHLSEKYGLEVMYFRYYAHNYYLSYASNWGLLSLIIFILMYFKLIRILYRDLTGQLLTEYGYKGHLNIAIISALIAILITFFAEHAFATIVPLFALLWFIIGVGYGIFYKNILFKGNR